MKILNRSLQLHLQVLSTISTVNWTEYREQISAPLTRKDLESFADQLNTIARQLNNHQANNSSNRFDHLAAKVKRIIHNDLESLKRSRDRILYKITALDVLMRPLSRQANQTLAQLERIQFFIDQHFEEIADRVFLV